MSYAIDNHNNQQRHAQHEVDPRQCSRKPVALKGASFAFAPRRLGRRLHKRLHRHNGIALRVNVYARIVRIVRRRPVRSPRDGLMRIRGGGRSLAFASQLCFGLLPGFDPECARI